MVHILAFPDILRNDNSIILPVLPFIVGGFKALIIFHKSSKKKKVAVEGCAFSPCLSPRLLGKCSETEI